MTGGYGSTEEAPAPPLESIVDGQTLDAPEPPGHRRHRSRGGSSTGGHHSRSESLIDSLADIVDVLQTIDEVAVDRPGGNRLSSLGGNDATGSTLLETTAAAAAGSASPAVSSTTTSGHVRTASRSARRGHSRGGSIVESIMDHVLDIRDGLVEGLEQADEGETEFCFLDMGLAREMSILPEDLVRVAEVTAPEQVLEMEESAFQDNNQVTTTTTDPEKQPLQEKDETLVSAPATIPLSAYLLLASAVVSLSSIGPLLNVQSGINPVLKIYWRMSGTALCLFPLAAASIYRDPGGINAVATSFLGPQFVTLLLTAASYATMCVAFVLALQYTAVGNAVILANSQSVLLLLGKMFVGDRILLLEAAGAIIAFAGATVCSVDSAAREQARQGDGIIDTTTSSGHANLTVLGDGLAMISALGGVFYLTFAKAVRPHFNLYVFMFLIMFCGSGMILIFMLIYGVSADYHVHSTPTVVTSLTHFQISIDRNIEHGIFGWMNWRYDRLPLELCMVILCNIFGAMGYVRAMQYFDNLIIAVATLLEPVIATLTAVFLGVGLFPGTLGWAGNAMVALGTFAVVYPSASSGKGGGGH